MILVDNGETITMSMSEALSRARNEELDLVQVSSKDNVPICKLMDYKKFMYAQRKREKSNAKSKQELKEIRLSDVIADNDLKVKAKNVDRILGEGDKVKIVIPYKGRAMAFISRGIDKLKTFDTMIESAHSIDREPKIEGNRVYMVVSPRK